MEWEGRRESDNVEDRRTIRPVHLAAGGGVGVLLIVLLTYLLGGNPQQVLNQLQNLQQPGGVPADAAADPAEDKLKHFVAVVLADTEDVWRDQFRRMGKTYQEPKLVLFSRQVESACGLADAAVGPFYCPGDHNVYLDLSFLQALESRFKAPGEFAKAYVIAHEVGHHVQNLLGISKKVHEGRQRLSKSEYNRLSVRLELQADFLAGFWGYHAQKMKHILAPGDLEAALRAANAIGDDRLQQQGRGYVVPDSFTHGTSEQRIRWFRRGFDSGDFSKRDTFKVPYDEL
ncbi:MAG TPA: neutral zinc metallopeptidase [Gemmataceae bacterium]|nr:neutral zinc metallopeptidase [Gemmataceae bacterium]